MKLMWQWSVDMLSIVADLKQFYERFSYYTHPNQHRINMLWGITIEKKLIPRFRSSCCHQRPGKLTTMTSILVSIPIITAENMATFRVTDNEIIITELTSMVFCVFIGIHRNSPSEDGVHLPGDRSKICFLWNEGIQELTTKENKILVRL